MAKNFIAPGNMRGCGSELYWGHDKRIPKAKGWSQEPVAGGCSLNVPHNADIGLGGARIVPIRSACHRPQDEGRGAIEPALPTRLEGTGEIRKPIARFG